MTEARLMDEADDDDLDGEPEAAAAIYADAREIIEMLLDRGADPNGEDGSALFRAVQMPDPSIARLLLERGADPNRGLAAGDAAYLPEIAESEETRQLLKRHGAKEDPYHPRRNYRAKGYVSIWLGRFGSKRKFTDYTTDPDMSDKVPDECFKEDFGVDVFDGVSYEEDFSPKPMAVGKLLARFSGCDSFTPGGGRQGEGGRLAICQLCGADLRFSLRSRPRESPARLPDEVRRRFPVLGRRASGELPRPWEIRAGPHGDQQGHRTLSQQ